MKNIFLNEKPVMTIVTIKRSNKEIYASVISREIDTTYAHTVKIIAQLGEEGLVESEKNGRKKILTLTEKGDKYGDLFVDMLEMFQEEEEEMDGNLSLEGKAPSLSDNEL